ncbi:MAG: hypothetical protein D8H95_21350 [Lachnospiraceae bacterium]|nr:MAG: hypothetical protein D8H95_21350 [Lachnospiraceae bacterium]
MKIHLLKAFLPLFIVCIIFVAFFRQIDCGSEGGYAFQISEWGAKLKNIYGTDFINKEIIVRDNTVQVDGIRCLYAVNQNEDGLSIYLLLSGGEYLTHNYVGSSFVKFSHSSEYSNMAYGEGSVEVSDSTSTGEVQNTEEKEALNKVDEAINNMRHLFASAIMVNLRVVELYKILTGCMILIAIVVIAGYYSYLKPEIVYELYCKLRRKEKYSSDVNLVKRIGFLTIILPPCMLFLLIL